MQSFAGVGDLAARWPRTFTEQEIPIVETVLLDASAYIASEMRRSRVPISCEDELQSLNLVKATCGVAKRALMPMLEAGGGGGLAAPVSKLSEQAGVFSASVTYANPMGDYYLTKAERESLGIGRVRVGSVRAAMFDMEERDRHGADADADARGERDARPCGRHF